MQTDSSRNYLITHTHFFFSSYFILINNFELCFNDSNRFVLLHILIHSLVFLYAIVLEFLFGFVFCCKI